MATPNIDSLLSRLRNGIASAAELETALGASQSWVSRSLRELTGRGLVLRLGITKGVRYGLRREIEGIGSHWALRRIDRAGRAHEMGTLYALARDQYFFEPTSETLAADFTWSGISDGLPYFLQDQRPGGFLGRAVPLRYPELNLPQRVVDWNDDHYLRYLTQRGSDVAGDLILGNAAFDGYLMGLRQEHPIAASERRTAYPRLANEVMRGGLPGSSAQGEHPKFAATLRDASGLRPVLVKFSPSTETAIGRRWSNLLIAEHLAHRILNEAGIAACRSRIEQIGDRMYLEVDRFDRDGGGRVGVTSLLAVDSGLYGVLDSWVASAMRLHRDRRIDTQALERIRLIAVFGALIANTDRHFGNLALFDAYNGWFEPAPVYDMLPMLFAPEHDQIVDRTFVPPDPTSDTINAWGQAIPLAQAYWRALATDARVDAEFRAICESCLLTVDALART